MRCRSRAGLRGLCREPSRAVKLAVRVTWRKLKFHRKGALFHSVECLRRADPPCV